MASDPEFTKLLGAQLVNAKRFYDWGIDRGLTTAGELKHQITTAERIATHNKLVKAGVSLRDAGKATGSSHQTVANDVKKIDETVKKIDTDAPIKLTTTKAAKTRTAHEEIAKFTFNQSAKDVPQGDPVRFGDFRELAAELKDNTVDLVFTDPPYDDESLPLYGEMGEIAARVLKPGGSLVTYCGHMQMIKAATALEKHLRFWQPLCCLHSGPAARLTEFGVVAEFKPMLWFVKGTRSDKHTFIKNVVTGQREKDHHEWQQAESEAAYFIEALSPAVGFVVDFFAGSATTIIAAHRLGRSAIGYEKSRKHHAAAMKRLGAL